MPNVLCCHLVILIIHVYEPVIGLHSLHMLGCLPLLTDSIQ